MRQPMLAVTSKLLDIFDTIIQDSKFAIMRGGSKINFRHKELRSKTDISRFSTIALQLIAVSASILNNNNVLVCCCHPFNGK